jgi:alanyl-tRNA synthetase
MGDTGPCGPCSEIFYDQGEEHFSSDEDVMGGDGDRFLEIWNLVFMQYERDESGTLNPLPKPSIDTGMGLERVVAIKEGVLNNYDSSLFKPYTNELAKIVGKEPTQENIASYRVIADHLRSTSFLLAQGVTFDKEGRGYVLRRIMRRAIRHGYLLGLREPFMYKLVDTLVEQMNSSYDYLESKKEAIKVAMKQEEERFFATIESGIKLFEQELKNTKDTFSGEVAFKLYDTYGFPLDLTQDMLREKGIKLDSDGFNQKMQQQKEQSKANWKGTGDAVAKGDFKELKENFSQNEFVGYEQTSTSAKVLALLDENFKQTDSLDGEGWVLLDKTPFYAESGGQVGDKGVIKTSSSTIEVLDTKKFMDLNLSQVNGALSVNQSVEAVVDTSRFEVAKHHSATHLLQAALKAVLGEHIAQAGSYNDESRLRFDFNHTSALSSEQIKEVEAWVNDKILRNISVNTEVMSIEDAQKSGAVALFGEKYGDKVRVVSMDDASIELCGGTHVKNTADIGLFVITKESGVSAGVRRVEAICGASALNFVNAQRELIAKLEVELKNKDLLSGVSKLKDSIKELKGELQAALSASKKELAVNEINGVSVIVDSVDAGDIKALIDEAKNRYEKVAIMLLQKKGEKVLLAAGSKECSINAGDWIKNIAPIVGGGGGGRADFAQAGGKDTSKIDEALKSALDYLEGKI